MYAPNNRGHMERQHGNRPDFSQLIEGVTFKAQDPESDGSQRFMVLDVVDIDDPKESGLLRAAAICVRYHEAHFGEGSGGHAIRQFTGRKKDPAEDNFYFIEDRQAVADMGGNPSRNNFKVELGPEVIVMVFDGIEEILGSASPDNVAAIKERIDARKGRYHLPTLSMRAQRQYLEYAGLSLDNKAVVDTSSIRSTGTDGDFTYTDEDGYIVRPDMPLENTPYDFLRENEMRVAGEFLTQHRRLPTLRQAWMLFQIPEFAGVTDTIDAENITVDDERIASVLDPDNQSPVVSLKVTKGKSLRLKDAFDQATEKPEEFKKQYKLNNNDITAIKRAWMGVCLHNARLNFLASMRDPDIDPDKKFR